MAAGMQMVVIQTLLGLAVRALAAETNLALSDSATFLDAGLTALGLLAALVTTVMRGRLDAENNTRDLLTYMEGEKYEHVQVLSNPAQHSLSKALLVVEEKSMEFAKQLFAYYAGTSAKNIDIIRACWLKSDCPQGKECNANMHRCKCLAFERVNGVSKHLIIIAKGDIFQVDPTRDGITSDGCRVHRCHGFSCSVYQDASDLSQLGSPVSGSDSQLLRCVSDLYVEEEGNTGLIMLDPVNDNSVQWSSTILEASMTKDAEDRGNENPFTVSYKNAMEGKDSTDLGREEYTDSSWYLARVGALVLASVLSMLFRTDPFSSVLLARRALRGYVVDKTGTKLPLQSFCSVASCSAVPAEKRAIIVLKPKRALPLALPQRSLWIAAGLEAIVVLLWITAISITPWEHVVGSSYLNDQPLWASIFCAACCVLASLLNAFYYSKAGNKRKWIAWSLVCAIIDAAVVCLACLLGVGAGVVRSKSKRHWVVTTFRGLMMLGALVQWVLGVQLIGSMTLSFRGATQLRIVPYALTYLRLLSLVAGGGKWA